MPRKIEAVVVDFDDTLCLTEATAFDLENTVLGRMGRLPMDRASHIANWGQPIAEAIAARSPGINVEEFLDNFYSAVAEFAADGRLDVVPPENYRALDELVSAGKQVMLLTSRTHDELKHILDPDHLLSRSISAFYYRDNTTHYKPDPRAFDNLLKTHGLSPEQCIYVGDSPTDAQASNGAGLYFVANLESGIRQEQDFADYSVDAYIQRFSDIVGAVAQIDRA